MILISNFRNLACVKFHQVNARALSLAIVMLTFVTNAFAQKDASAFAGAIDEASSQLEGTFESVANLCLSAHWSVWSVAHRSTSSGITATRTLPSVSSAGAVPVCSSLQQVQYLKSFSCNNGRHRWFQGVQGVAKTPCIQELERQVYRLGSGCFDYLFLTVCACRESSRCPVWYGDADSQFRTVYVIHTVQTESGTPQPGFGCGLLHRTTYSPG